MKTIWKYSLPDWENDILVPRNSFVSHFAIQNGVPTVWVMINSEGEEEMRHFRVVGTGHQIQKDEYNCGTTIDGSFVWHLMERIRDYRFW